ncbi:MAG TPA: helix-turn-helix domain-containing protein [Solirubrobacteraceae bacterium]|nr:helix-turn-helix domain-containing protein [Solirubrobacteraceae bacterium]
MRANGGNVSAAARELGVSKALVTRLRDLHEIEPLKPGAARLGEASPYRLRTVQKEIVARVLDANGGNVKRTARETGLPESTVRRWKAQRDQSQIGLEEFLARTHRDEETGCLLWDGPRNPGGYGLLHFGGRTQLAHRAAYELAHGTKLMSEEHLHHVCHNPSCVEGGHLLPVAPEGQHGHAALHQLEDVLAAELAASAAAPWPAWMNAASRVGSVEPPETIDEKAGQL